MQVKSLLHEIANESGIGALSQAVSQLHDRAEKGVWKDVITTSDAMRVLLLTGTSSNWPIIRDATKWLLGQQDRITGSWNDEVWDTSAALLALKAVGFDAASSPVRKGIKAICDQYDPQARCWWDIWDTCISVQCFTQLEVEQEKVKNAIRWLMEKQYPPPHNNWLNLHTTALVLEILSNSEFKWDAQVLKGKEWLEREVKGRMGDLDAWSLALSLRALNCYSRPGAEATDFVKHAIRSRLIPAINLSNLDTVDLCQVSLTLRECAPTIMTPAMIKAIAELTEKDQRGLADLFVTTACVWTVGGMVGKQEEKALNPYFVRIGLTERQAKLIGLLGGLASIIGLLLWFFLSR